MDRSMHFENPSGKFRCNIRTVNGLPFKWNEMKVVYFVEKGEGGTLNRNSVVELLPLLSQKNQKQQIIHPSKLARFDKN